MRIDLGLVLAIILECIYFIYYADSLFYRKKSKSSCYSAIIAGYLIHGIVCMFGNTLINIGVFIGVNFLIFSLCYHINYKNAIFQSVVLSVVSIATEFAVVLGMIGLDLSKLNSTLPITSLILTIFSKSLYLIAIIALIRLFRNHKGSRGASSKTLMAATALTLFCLILIIYQIDQSKVVAAICIGLVIINLIVFGINQSLVKKDLEAETLKMQLAKEKIDFEEYRLLKEKYEQIRVLHHDFKEHMNVLSALVSDNNEKAKEYIKSLYHEEDISGFEEYSDNKMLNIVLSKKKKECRDADIQFVIDPIQASLTFFSDIDVVTVFSNLISNAIEGCKNSNIKKIFLNIYTANENFVVIKIKNTSDLKPVVVEGLLKTHKDNTKLHGIGMDSIKRALSNYKATLNWDYDEAEKLFCARIIINKSMIAQKIN